MHIGSFVYIALLFRLPETRNLKPETRNAKPETVVDSRQKSAKIDMLVFWDRCGDATSSRAVKML